MVKIKSLPLCSNKNILLLLCLIFSISATACELNDAPQTKSIISDTTTIPLGTAKTTMKFLRVGNIGAEKPALLDNNIIRDLSSVIKDIDQITIGPLLPLE